MLYLKDTSHLIASAGKEKSAKNSHLMHLQDKRSSRHLVKEGSFFHYSLFLWQTDWARCFSWTYLFISLKQSPAIASASKLFKATRHQLPSDLLLHRLLMGKQSKNLRISLENIFCLLALSKPSWCHSLAAMLIWYSLLTPGGRPDVDMLISGTRS